MSRISPTVGLRSALLVAVVVPLLVVFGAGGWLALGAIEQRLEARLHEDIELIARTLQVPLARSLERSRERAVDRTLWSTYEFGRVYGVYVYDADGELVAGADREAGGAGEGGIDIGALDETTGGEYDSIAGREVYSYFAPLTATNGRVIGMLRVTRDAREIRGYIDSLYTGAGLALLAVAAAVGLAMLFTHYLAIGRPLTALSRAMEGAGGGDTSIRVPQRGPLELRRLAGRFNAMLDGLARKDRDLAARRAEHDSLQERLRESEKYAMVGRLAAGVAHELGTPLAVVDGHAQRLAREPGEAGRRAPGIRAAVTRMSEVIRSLLGFSTTPSGSRRKAALDEPVALAASDVQAQFDAASTTLEIGTDASVAVASTDVQRLREALVHLLRNAMQAAPGGTVRVGVRGGSGGPGLFVEDSGDGIDDDARERIFEPFYTTKAPGDGSGLGLAIVRRIAADHDADLEIYNSELGGAGFAIRFKGGEHGA